MNNEEVKCAQVIAHDERVECWVRNLEREQTIIYGFRRARTSSIPISSRSSRMEKFLQWNTRAGTWPGIADTVEKERLGKLWEERSSGQCFFEMVKGPGELGKIQDAIKKASATTP